MPKLRCVQQERWRLPSRPYLREPGQVLGIIAELHLLRQQLHQNQRHYLLKLPLVPGHRDLQADQLHPQWLPHG